MNKLSQYITPNNLLLIFSLKCIVFFLLPITGLLEYNHNAITNGEWWRLMTGNLLHTNFWHLAMNLAGLWVTFWLYKQHLSVIGLFSLLVSLSFLEGFGLFIFYPELHYYVGLSGVLHGFFVHGALMDIKKRQSFGYLLFAGVIAKVSYEQIYGASTELASIIGARVATEAHLVGLIAGILLFLGFNLGRINRDRSR